MNFNGLWIKFTNLTMKNTKTCILRKYIIVCPIENVTSHLEFLKTFSAYNCSNNDYQQSLFTQALRILCRFMPSNSGIIPHTLHCANTRLLTDVYVVHGVIPLKICHLWLKFCINIVSLSFKLKKQQWILHMSRQLNCLDMWEIL